MPDLCETILLLVEYLEITTSPDFKLDIEGEQKEIQDKLLEDWTEKVLELLKGITTIVDNVNYDEKDALNSDKVLNYQKGMCYGIWYSFFYLKVPSNCPVILLKN